MVIVRMMFYNPMDFRFEEEQIDKLKNLFNALIYIGLNIYVL
jgi:hypothetical protein